MMKVRDKAAPSKMMKVLSRLCRHPMPKVPLELIRDERKEVRQQLVAPSSAAAVAAPAAVLSHAGDGARCWVLPSEPAITTVQLCICSPLDRCETSAVVCHCIFMPFPLLPSPQVKGHISGMAVCLEDSDQRIADRTRHFFHELARKGE